MAVYASPRQTVIAGPPEQVDAVIAVVAAAGSVGPPGRAWMWPPITASSIRSCPSCVRRWPIWRPSPRRIPMLSTVDRRGRARRC